MNPTTHWWMFSLSVHNDFRGSSGHIEYYWYTDVVTRFEAFYVCGPPSRTWEPSIRILFNGRVVGAHRSKELALGQLREFQAKIPPTCRREFEASWDYLLRAIHG